jgi:hypothetical protein
LIVKAKAPKKASKQYPLTKADQQANHQDSIKRIKVENIFGFLKHFKVFAINTEIVESGLV